MSSGRTSRSQLPAPPVDGEPAVAQQFADGIGNHLALGRCSDASFSHGIDHVRARVREEEPIIKERRRGFLGLYEQLDGGVGYAGGRWVREDDGDTRVGHDVRQTLFSLPPTRAPVT
eukprot:CAMPEP_0174719258 /NCGR_PEP_ID=MMETSP1094-20130205/30877_1 /TAXON_ID=156173 /ORGANISM="Chrysochromulina brevifilum, Strain UTEX LB 985" /LENGTH=116 /DNA_ID=CAMNT_0015919529 /DNA_START=520 /DNA_END=871 /DNA_ORIENTATION=-